MTNNSISDSQQGEVSNSTENATSAASAFMGAIFDRFTMFPFNFWPQFFVLSHSAQNCYLYILKHTLGFRENGAAKRFTIDEYQHGKIRKKDGTRLDNGTGLSKAAVVYGLRELEDHKYIVVEKSGTKARTKKTYRAAIPEDFESGGVYEIRTPENDQAEGSVFKFYTPGRDPGFKIYTANARGRRRLSDTSAVGGENSPSGPPQGGTLRKATRKAHAGNHSMYAAHARVNALRHLRGALSASQSDPENTESQTLEETSLPDNGNHPQENGHAHQVRQSVQGGAAQPSDKSRKAKEWWAKRKAENIESLNWHNEVNALREARYPVIDLVVFQKFLQDARIFHNRYPQATPSQFFESWAAALSREA